MFEITQNYTTKNRSNEKLSPIGMVVHSTDTKGATDENERNYYNNNNLKANANAFIDWDSITETVPDSEVAWGSGNTSNHRFLQVELCEPKTYNPSQFTEVWNRAVWYFAYKFVNVLKINTVTKDNLMSHEEVSLKWHETNHTDPRGYLAQYRKTIDQFRAEVQSMINTINNVERIVDNMQIKDVQHVCNVLGIKDFEGKVLVEDNANGKRTESARTRLKEILTYILK